MNVLAVLLAGWLVSERPIITAVRNTQCEQVMVAVYKSGAAHYWAWSTCVEPVTVDAGLCRLSESDVTRLTHHISKDFASLPESIEPTEKVVVTGEEILSIQVWQGEKGIAKRVTAEGLERMGDDSVAKRFSALWHAVMSCCPRRSE